MNQAKTEARHTAFPLNMRYAITLFAVCVIAFGASNVGAQGPGKPPDPCDAGKITVKPGAWKGTSVTLRKGQVATVTATGTMRYKDHPWIDFGAGGDSYAVWSLHARVGSQIVEVAGRGSFTAEQDGEIELGAPARKNKPVEEGSTYLDQRYHYCASVTVTGGADPPPEKRKVITTDSTSACVGGRLAWLAGAVLLGAPPAPAVVPSAPTTARPSVMAGPPSPNDLNHPQNTKPTVSGKEYVDWLKKLEALNPDKSRGQIIAAIHGRSHQGIDKDRALPGTDIKLFANGPESDGWESVKFPTRHIPVFVTDTRGQKIDISHTIAGLRADLNRPERVISIGCAQFMRWANTDGGDSWQQIFQGGPTADFAPPDQRAGNALGIKASNFYRDPTATNVPLSKFFETEFPK